jgi:hypothetical protein
MRSFFAHSQHRAAEIQAQGKINIFRDFGCRFELARLFFCLSGSECEFMWKQRVNQEVEMRFEMQTETAAHSRGIATKIHSGIKKCSAVEY